jgi:hypothetical protein
MVMSAWISEGLLWFAHPHGKIKHHTRTYMVWVGNQAFSGMMFDLAMWMSKPE